MNRHKDEWLTVPEILGGSRHPAPDLAALARTWAHSRSDQAAQQGAAHPSHRLRGMAGRSGGVGSVSSSYDVRVWAIRVRRNRPNPYQVRWRVGTASPFAKSFRTSALADSFRSELIAATRRGEAFDTDAGLPVSHTREQTAITWYEHAIDYIDMKWPGAAGKSRISIVETLTAVTPVLVRSDHGVPDEAVLRVALRRWAFNPVHRHDQMPAEIRAALAWLRRTRDHPCSGLALPANSRHSPVRLDSGKAVTREQDRLPSITSKRVNAPSANHFRCVFKGSDGTLLPLADARRRAALANLDVVVHRCQLNLRRRPGWRRPGRDRTPGIHGSAIRRGKALRRSRQR